MQTKQTIDNCYKNKGFSIMEIVVVIYVISMALVGVMALVVQTIQAKQINTNTVVASMLAQEGLELVRNIRDTNWLEGVAYDDGIPNGDFIIDYLLLNTPAAGIGDAAAKLYLEGNYYCHSFSGCNDSVTQFSRIVNVDNSAGNFLDVTSQVRWTVGGQNYDYIAETYLYNWQ